MSPVVKTPSKYCNNLVLLRFKVFFFFFFFFFAHLHLINIHEEPVASLFYEYNFKTIEKQSENIQGTYAQTKTDLLHM